MTDREKFCNLDLIIFAKLPQFKNYYFNDMLYSDDDVYDKYSFISSLFEYYIISNIGEKNNILNILDELYIKGNKPMKDIILLGFLEKVYDNKKEILSIYKGLVNGLREIESFNQ